MTLFSKLHTRIVQLKKKKKSSAIHYTMEVIQSMMDTCLRSMCVVSLPC